MASPVLLLRKMRVYFVSLGEACNWRNFIVLIVIAAIVVLQCAIVKQNGRVCVTIAMSAITRRLPLVCGIRRDDHILLAQHRAIRKIHYLPY